MFSVHRVPQLPSMHGPRERTLSYSGANLGRVPSIVLGCFASLSTVAHKLIKLRHPQRLHPHKPATFRHLRHSKGNQGELDSTDLSTFTYSYSSDSELTRLRFEPWSRRSFPRCDKDCRAHSCIDTCNGTAVNLRFSVASFWEPGSIALETPFPSPESRGVVLQRRLDEAQRQLQELTQGAKARVTNRGQQS